MRCASWIGRKDKNGSERDPRCPNEGTHDEWSEDYSGHGVWISFCDFHWKWKHST